MNNFEKSNIQELSDIQLTPSNNENQENLSMQKGCSFKKWSNEENIFYLRFLKAKGKKYSMWTSRKFCKYEKMSLFISTKTANQCRSHHQKMLLKYKTVENIVEEFSQKLLNKPVQKRLFQENSKIKQVVQPDLQILQQKTIEEKIVDQQSTEQMRYKIHFSQEESIFNVLF